MRDRPPPEICPICGEDVPRRAKACPECGSCYETGWNEDESVYDAAGIPDHGHEDNVRFDYDEWLAREGGHHRLPGAIHPSWKWAVIVIIIAFVVLTVVRR